MNCKFEVGFMSYMDFMKIINNLDYVRIKCTWYHHPKFSFESGVRLLNNDAYVLKFGKDMNNYDVVNIYVEHIVDWPIVISEEQVKEYVEPELTILLLNWYELSVLWIEHSELGVLLLN